MNNKHYDLVQWLIGAIIIFVLSLFALIVVTATRAYATSHMDGPAAREWPPRIEQCDLSMWERVRYECPTEKSPLKFSR